MSTNLSPAIVKALRELSGRSDWNVPGPEWPFHVPTAPAPIAHWSMTHREAIVSALVHQRDTTQSASAHAAAVDALNAMGVDHE